MARIAKISGKGQVTVPVEVRRALGIKAGDVLIWDVESKDRATVRRAQPIDVDYLTAISGTLSEWASAEDDEAFRDL
jgi:AbrB family looped-hinge helix DNA binding protein